MNIAFITHDFVAGGAGRAMCLLARRLRPRDQVSIFTSHHAPVPAPLTEAGVGVHFIHARPLPLTLRACARPGRTRKWRWFTHLRYLPRTLRGIRRARPDVVVLNGYYNLYYAPLLHRRARIVFYAHEIPEGGRAERWLIRALVDRFVDHAVCCTVHEQAPLRALGVSTPLTVIANFNEAAIPAELRPPRAHEGVRVGVIGQIREQKGQHLVVEAARLHAAALRAARVSFHVYGRRFEELAARAARAGVQDLVQFHGWTDDVPAVLGDLDLLLRPDQSGSPWGRDIVEAMSRGLPIVAAGDSDVYVKPGATGELYPVMDLDAMIRCVLELAGDRARRRRYGRNALAFARTHFDPETNTARFRAVFAATGAGSQPARTWPGVFVHESAVVDEGVEIGAGTRIWHFSHLLGNTRIGAGCNVGQNVMIGPNVTIGERCKIQNNVSIYEGVSLEDDVFCGPSAVFTNDMTPRAHVTREGKTGLTRLCQGASVGANATVLCGLTLGRHCMVGAGAVVTADVPDHALVMGNPARRTAWVCACGARLDAALVCPACAAHYRRTPTGLVRGQDSARPPEVHGLAR